MSYIGPIPNESLLGFVPLAETQFTQRLMARGPGRAAIEAAANGAQLGTRHGSWQTIVAGAALGLGALAWAFWRSRPENPSSLTVRASSDAPSNPPGTEPAAQLPAGPTETTAAANDNIALDFAKVVSGPFTTQAEAEAELVRRVAAETQPLASPYAVIHDTHTGYFYVCEILGSGNITSSFLFVTYAVKLGDSQSEADAIPSLSSLAQANGEPLRVIGVWSESQFVITITSPVANTLNPSVVVLQVSFELHNQEKLTLSEQVMLTFPDKPYIKIFIEPSVLQNVLRNGTEQEVNGRLSVFSFHPLTQEPASTLADIRLRVRPGVGAVTVDINHGVRSSHIEYYTSGDTRLRIPSSPRKSLPVYLPIVR